MEEGIHNDKQVTLGYYESILAMKLVIRPFKKGDLDKIYTIEKRSFRDPWSKTAFLYLTELKNIFFIVACCGERILGYIIAAVKRSDNQATDKRKGAHLLNLAVTPDLRHRGIGEALLQNLEEILIRNKVRYIDLEVRPSNQKAISFYLNHNFKEKRVVPLYYIDEDAIVMIKELEDKRAVHM